MKYLERWVPIVGFEENYQISSFGRVKSRPRPGAKGGGIMRPSKYKAGKDLFYFKLILCKDKKKFTKLHHRLMAQHFLSNINQKPLVCHKDGNGLNNKLENLYWGTHKENTRDMVLSGRSFFHTGKQNSKLTPSIVTKIRELLLSGVTQSLIAQKYGVDQSNISYIKTNKTWVNIS